MGYRLLRSAAWLSGGDDIDFFRAGSTVASPVQLHDESHGPRGRQANLAVHGPCSIRAPPVTRCFFRSRGSILGPVGGQLGRQGSKTLPRGECDPGVRGTAARLERHAVGATKLTASYW